jgi:methylmalonyl-CoA/ethylmalonyl-CoA epimerase
MEIEKIDHIGIAVKNLSSALKLYTDVLGLKVKRIEEFEDLKVKVAFIPVGEVLVELVQPKSAEAPLAKRINAHGEGLYHLAYRVRSIDDALEEIKKKGIEMRDNEARPGGMGSRIALSKPDSTNNVIIELVERSEEI